MIELLLIHLQMRNLRLEGFEPPVFVQGIWDKALVFPL